MPQKPGGETKPYFAPLLRRLCNSRSMLIEQRVYARRLLLACQLPVSMTEYSGEEHAQDTSKRHLKTVHKSHQPRRQDCYALGVANCSSNHLKCSASICPQWTSCTSMRIVSASFVCCQYTAHLSESGTDAPVSSSIFELAD